MKCQMPGCNHESVKTISESGIYFGFSAKSKLEICENHDNKSVETHIQKLGEEQSEDSQLVNPFLICKSLNRSCV